MKRVLLASYYFPPSGGPGVQRPLAMATHLPEFGWEVTVLTVDPDYAAWPVVDERLLSEVPGSVRVERTRAWDPYSAYARLSGKKRSQAVGVGFADDDRPGWRERAARWVRANLFLPDARIGWIRAAGKRALTLHRDRPFDAVITTGPPQSTHLMVHRHRSELSIPWIADFRDAWPDPAYARHLPMTGWAAKRDAGMRRRVLASADHAIAVAEGMVPGLRRDGAESVTVIPNGFRESDFAGSRAGETATWDREPRVILHAGNLPTERNPALLWKVAGAFRGRLRIVLLGSVDSSVRASIHEAGLDDMVQIEPQVPHDEAVRRMIAADGLLLAINRVEGAEAIVTGKVFEYIASGRPVIGVGPPRGEAAALLRDSDAGRMVDFDDEAGLRDTLVQWLEGNVAGASWQAALPLSRRSRARDLAHLLDDLS